MLDITCSKKVTYKLQLILSSVCVEEKNNHESIDRTPDEENLATELESKSQAESTVDDLGSCKPELLDHDDEHNCESEASHMRIEDSQESPAYHEQKESHASQPPKPKDDQQTVKLGKGTVIPVVYQLLSWWLSIFSRGRGSSQVLFSQLYRKMRWWCQFLLLISLGVPAVQGGTNVSSLPAVFRDSLSNLTAICDFSAVVVVEEFMACPVASWWALLIVLLLFSLSAVTGVAVFCCVHLFCCSGRREVLRAPPPPLPPMPDQPLPANSQPCPPDGYRSHEQSNSSIVDDHLTSFAISFNDDGITDVESCFAPPASIQALDGPLALSTTSVLFTDPSHREAVTQYPRHPLIVLEGRALKRVDGELLVGTGQDSKPNEVVDSNVTSGSPLPVSSEENDVDINRRLLHSQELENQPVAEGKPHQDSYDGHKGNTAFVGLQCRVIPTSTPLLPNPSPNTANITKHAHVHPVGDDFGCVVHSEGALQYFQCVVEQSVEFTNAVDTTGTVPFDTTDVITDDTSTATCTASTEQVNAEPGLAPTEGGSMVRENYPCALDHQDLLVQPFVNVY